MGVSFMRDRIVPRPLRGEPHGTQGTMRVTLVAGTGLVDADVITKSDPYAIADLGLQRQRTQTVMNNNDPQWNEVLYLGVNDEHLGLDLELSVWDEDEKALQGTDDFLGRLLIPVSRVKQAVGEIELTEVLKDVPKGTITVKLELIPAETISSSLPPPAPAQPA